MEVSMISKKDLLKKMQISYGQLYRWKREGLIPYDWFIKQSVSTGQETFFNKEAILKRIQIIIELKDKYQLDEIKEYLSPNLSEKKFRIKDVMLIKAIDPYIAKKYCDKKEVVDLIDVVILYIFSTNQDILNFDDYIHYDFSHVRSENSVFFILDVNDSAILIAPQSIVIDKSIRIKRKIKFEDIISIIAKEI